MVECMEAWLLADKQALSEYFGQGFRLKALPRAQNVEKVSKNDVLNGLDQATRGSKTKGSYDKGRDSFQLLGRVNGGKLRRSAPRVELFVQAISDRFTRP
jgi:hypothetical protein